MDARHIPISGADATAGDDVPEAAPWPVRAAPPAIPVWDFRANNAATARATAAVPHATPDRPFDFVAGVAVGMIISAVLVYFALA